MTLKIALCMSGHARTYDQTYIGWNQHLLTQHNVDVFFHIWDTLGPRLNGGGLDGQTGVQESPSVLLDDIVRLWNPVQITMEKHDAFHNAFIPRARKWYETRARLGLRTIDRPLANFSMYYKWWACNKLKNQYAEQTGTTYDVVIRSRPDICLYDYIPSECFTDQNFTYLSKKGSWSTIEISDYITIGTKEQLDHWCRVYEMIDEKYESALAAGDFTQAIFPHNMFYYHFVNHNQPYKEMPINCEIIR